MLATCVLSVQLLTFEVVFTHPWECYSRTSQGKEDRRRHEHVAVREGYSAESNAKGRSQVDEVGQDINTFLNVRRCATIILNLQQAKEQRLKLQFRNINKRSGRCMSSQLTLSFRSRMFVLAQLGIMDCCTLNKTNGRSVLAKARRAIC